MTTPRLAPSNPEVQGWSPTPCRHSGMQKLTTRPEQERREFQKAGKNRGGLLQSDSLALWQNAPEPMDQNRTQKLPSH